jgi:hypothetical protein
MKRSSHWMRAWALALLGCSWLAAAPARGATSFEFLFSTDRVSNDHQLFLNLAVSNSGYDRAVLEPVLPRIHSVEVDLPVVLFVAQQCGRPVDYVVDLRARGLSWSAIFTQLNVRPDVLFVGIDRDPGPPYGKAWGYWRKNPQSIRLSDDDIRGLVQVQMGSRWAGASPYDLAHARSQGKAVVTFVADKHGRPYRDEGGAGKGAGHGKEKGHGHGHGHD